MINNPKLLKQMKNSSSIKELFLQAALEEHSNYCVNCRSPREVVEQNDLPEKTKEAFKELLEMDDYKSGSTFLYCKKCKEHAIQSQNFGSFHDD